jgi:mRNA-degrading endonuclease toxin of MazEF toxin-antitoxin module
VIDVATPDGKATGLRQNSVVSCIHIATVASNLMARTIGRLSPALMIQVDGRLKVALGLP